eukprot:TRINITY_DN590987_c0_g1_i1.p1 TRINITY_DN590987_c0_g1~~TRINITY_DN590987_c0_g1_i1.p1  ORF type:complete len:1054 (-),score=329.14 TRINITY_DN590987_c0_g1_i1:193-3354(-)
MMERLLDFSVPFDVPLLDQVVSSAFLRNDAQALNITTQFSAHPQSWTKVDQILSESSDRNTHFLAIRILEQAIAKQWEILPEEQKAGIKGFIVDRIIAMSRDDESLEKCDSGVLLKMNLALVAIVKKEWPHNWPTFIPELVESSKSSETLCQNNMDILKLLSEDIFDFAEEDLVSKRKEMMSSGLNEEFGKIFELCEMIFNNSTRIPLIQVTLEAFERFITWIPVGYIFQTDLLPQLVTKFFEVSQFRNGVMKCLREVASLEITSDLNDTVKVFFRTFMEQLCEILPLDVDIAEAFKTGDDNARVFINELAQFFHNILSRNLELFEDSPELHEYVKTAFQYVLKISYVDDNDIFKVCTKLWNFFAKSLYESYISAGRAKGPLNLDKGEGRKAFYAEICSGARLVHVVKMAKPEEVLIEEQNDEIVRARAKDTDTIAQYKIMRATLVHLTHIDHADTERIMLEKMARQMNRSEYSWHGINTLCWAVGAIAGAMTARTEDSFLISIIGDLLQFVKEAYLKDDKAVVASNIMYIVGQYPTFLKQHWSFLRTVCNKLCDFMHESHEGIQDMACDTLSKIVRRCRDEFVKPHERDPEVYAQTLVNSVMDITRDLEPHQEISFYCTVAQMIRAIPSAETKANMMFRLLNKYSEDWSHLLQSASRDHNVLKHIENTKLIRQILKINTAVCESVGWIYSKQLEGILTDMLAIMQTYSDHIGELIRENGPAVVSHTLPRHMRHVQAQVVLLLEAFFKHIKQETAQSIASHLLPTLSGPILEHYHQVVPACRNKEVLSLYATGVSKMKEALNEHVGSIVDNLFKVTIDHNDDLFLMELFKLLHALLDHTFQSLFSNGPEQCQLVVDTVLWGIQKMDTRISDVALKSVVLLIDSISKSPRDFAQPFYQQYFTRIVGDVLFVMTDGLHKNGFAMHVQILRKIFTLVESGAVSIPLFDTAKLPQFSSNQEFIRDKVLNDLCTHFPNLSRTETTEFVASVFNVHLSMAEFRTAVRDFLIRMKEFAADSGDLFREEKEQAEEKKRLADLEAQLAVPGLAPDQDDDEDL